MCVTSGVAARRARSVMLKTGTGDGTPTCVFASVLVQLAVACSLLTFGWSRHAMATPEVPRRDLAWQGGGRVTSGPSEVAQGPT